MLRVTDANRKWWILIAMSVGGGLMMLDETVVGVALPVMRHDLGMSASAAHWVVNSYMLVFAGLAAAAGRLGDLVGFKRLMLAGVAVFGIASLVAGFAESGTFLIVVRAIEGIGAAIILPGTVAMIMLVFPPEQRGMAIGVLAAIGTSFLALGPLVGGFLTEVVSWRWIFWINVPIVAVIAGVVAIAWIDPQRQPVRAAFDVAGTAALVLGLSMVVFATMQGSVWGWTQGLIIALLAGGIAALLLFVVVERRVADPLIDVALFRDASFSACNGVLFAGQYAKLAIVIFLPLFLQDVVRMSPLDAGLALLVAVAAFPFLSAPVGRLADKYGARPLVLAGLAAATVGMAWLAVAVPWNSYWVLLPGLVLWGLGMPFCYAPTLRAMSNAVPTEKQGQTSGIGVTSRLFGGAIGTAVSSALLVGVGSYRAVFFATAAAMAASLVFAALAIKREDGEKKSPHQRPDHSTFVHSCPGLSTSSLPR